jgi:hypothetical protein
MFPSNYLAAVEFGNRVFNGKIESVKIAKLESEDGRQKDKGVVFFEGNEKGWVLCKTNAICLAAMFGDDTANWVGHSVTLFATPVKVGKKIEPGIRVKGSPDLEKTLEVEIKLPRRNAFTMVLQATGKPAAKQNGTGAAPRAASRPTPAARTPEDDPPPPDTDGPPPDDFDQSAPPEPGSNG